MHMQALGSKTNHKSIRYLIYALRTSLGLNQKELAEDLGVDQSTVSRWEAGTRYPSLPQLKSIILYAQRKKLEHLFDIKLTCLLINLDTSEVA